MTLSLIGQRDRHILKRQSQQFAHCGMSARRVSSRDGLIDRLMFGQRIARGLAGVLLEMGGPLHRGAHRA
jgi:hypothetical protein